FGGRQLMGYRKGLYWRCRACRARRGTLEYPRAAGRAVRFARPVYTGVSRAARRTRHAGASVRTPHIAVPRALIAEDEPLLRAQLKARLVDAWPDLDLLGEAATGGPAPPSIGELHPD